MVDRVTGTTWYLIYDTDQDRCQLTDTLSVSQMYNAKVYQPYDGPFIEGTNLKMGVSNAHIVFDNSATGDSGAGPYGFTSDIVAKFFGVFVKPGFNAYDHIGFTSFSTRHHQFVLDVSLLDSPDVI